MSPTTLPLQRYLAALHEKYRAMDDGTVTTYIPELAKADPDWFGICVVTTDGYVYAVGDSEVPFTIQSVSKPAVYAAALADRGREAVLRRVGVEPSGEAFNSIRLTNDNRPFNPMVNAGAIACSGLIHQVESKRKHERLRDGLDGERHGAVADLVDMTVDGDQRDTEMRRVCSLQLGNVVGDCA